MNPRVKCIIRLIEKQDYSQFTEFLLANKFASAEDLSSARNMQERAELIFTSLKRAEAEEKLLLLDFEWTILPFEQIKITLVTAREEKHFTYGF